MGVKVRGKKERMRSPLEQFRSERYITIYNKLIDITITKTTIYMIISIMILLIILQRNKENIIPKRYAYIIELMYIEWSKQIKEILGKDGKRYIVLIKSLFYFILINNLVGMIPYSFTTTSQLIITLTFSLSIFLGVTFTGILNQGLMFIKLFIPSGIPKALLPFLFIIELISYFFRIISLSVRLTGNIVAGHTILKIVSSLGLKLANFSKILILLPFSFLFLLIGLELGVAFIQSYVFAILTTNYIKDSFSHH